MLGRSANSASRQALTPRPPTRYPFLHCKENTASLFGHKRFSNSQKLSTRTPREITHSDDNQLRTQKGNRFELLYERKVRKEKSHLEKQLEQALSLRAQDWMFEEEEWNIVGATPGMDCIPRDALQPGNQSLFVEAIPERPWIIGNAAFGWVLEMKQELVHLGLTKDSKDFTLQNDHWNILFVYGYEPMHDSFLMARVFNLNENSPEFTHITVDPTSDTLIQDMQQAEEKLKATKKLHRFPSFIVPVYFTPDREVLRTIQDMKNMYNPSNIPSTPL